MHIKAMGLCDAGNGGLIIFSLLFKTDRLFILPGKLHIALQRTIVPEQLQHAAGRMVPGHCESAARKGGYVQPVAVERRAPVDTEPILNEMVPVPDVWIAVPAETV